MPPNPPKDPKKDAYVKKRLEELAKGSVKVYNVSSEEELLEALEKEYAGSERRKNVVQSEQNLAKKALKEMEDKE